MQRNTNDNLSTALLPKDVKIFVQLAEDELSHSEMKTKVELSRKELTYYHQLEIMTKIGLQDALIKAAKVEMNDSLMIDIYFIYNETNIFDASGIRSIFKRAQN